MSYAALSATTAQTIVGTKPFIKFNGVVATNLDQLLSFDMPDGSGGTITIDPTVTTTINAPPGYRFNQFVTKVIADGTTKDLSTTSGVAYDDSDGDTPHLTSPVAGTLKATWSYLLSDGTTKILSAADLSGILDACNGTYKLSISISNIKVQSRYGVPIDNDYGSASKTYTINVNDYKVCYAKPAEMTVYSNSGIGAANTCTTTANCKYIGGYNPAVFVPGSGFLSTAPTKFPTTGFNKAKFTLKMSNAQSDYTYTSSNPSLVAISNVSGSEGEVTFNSVSKPTLPLNITLTARTKAGVTTLQ